VIKLLFFLLLFVGCGAPEPRYLEGVPRQAGSLVLSADGTTLVVVNPDSDTLSVIDVGARTLLRELALGPRPQVAEGGRYEPLLGPRGVDLHPSA
jgi:YVTN family beta-propeller protein